MFTRILAILPLALVVVAQAPFQCNTGNAFCCNKVESVQQAQSGLPDLDVVKIVAGVAGNVGIQCTSATIIGTSHSCAASQKPTCCQQNLYNGLINVGCSDVTASV